MNPKIFAIGRLHDQLVKVTVEFNPIEPLAGGLKVGVTLVVIPSGIACERQADVSSFAQGVLGCIGSANLDVELVAAVAGGDDDGATNEGAEGLQYLLAELLKDRDVLRRYAIVNAMSLGSSGFFKLMEHEMLR